jgi:hypothetical protein
MWYVFDVSQDGFNTVNQVMFYLNIFYVFILFYLFIFYDYNVKQITVKWETDFDECISQVDVQIWKIVLSIQ